MLKNWSMHYYKITTTLQLLDPFIGGAHLLVHPTLIIQNRVTNMDIVIYTMSWMMGRGFRGVVS